MRSTWLRCGLVVTTLGVVPLDLSAASFDGGAPNQVSGTNMSEQLVAERFEVPYNTTFSEIRFWAIRNVPETYRGSVHWAVYSDDAGQPDEIVEGGVEAVVSAVVSGQSTAFGYAESELVVPVDFVLPPGAYWLALHNGPLADNSEAEMHWETAVVPDNLLGTHGSASATEALYLADGAWVGTGNSLAFKMIDPVLFANGFEAGDAPWTVPPPSLR